MRFHPRSLSLLVLIVSAVFCSVLPGRAVADDQCDGELLATAAPEVLKQYEIFEADGPVKVTWKGALEATLDDLRLCPGRAGRRATFYLAIARFLKSDPVEETRSLVNELLICGDCDAAEKEQYRNLDEYLRKQEAPVDEARRRDQLAESERKAEAAKRRQARQQARTQVKEEARKKAEDEAARGLARTSGSSLAGGEGECTYGDLHQEFSVTLECAALQDYSNPENYQDHKRLWLWGPLGEVHIMEAPEPYRTVELSVLMATLGRNWTARRSAKVASIQLGDGEALIATRRRTGVSSRTIAFKLNEQNITARLSVRVPRRHANAALLELQEAFVEGFTLQAASGDSATSTGADSSEGPAAKDAAEPEATGGQ